MLLGILACSRPLPPAPTPLQRAASAPETVLDAGPCVEPDRDGDGVVDVCDVCPELRGVRPHGCPQRAAEAAETDAPHRPAVEAAATWMITPRVFFDAGSAALSRRGRDALDQIAALMRAHLELRRLELRGHASVGERDASALARQRAEAARGYLVARGIAAERLEAHGYGTDDPRESSATPAGRAANRRVEPSILEAVQPSRTPSADERPMPVMPAGCPDAPREGRCAGAGS